eukprot:TRINITY_DN21683_c0_g1_i1.p3 TRINITY_DN21683_c0_g1~~TRINITY_DN21683_c0_g1_i1.p3  ORF type:complete len:102 (+),score=1.77 TRINITY_DN21683_c0_g1_i1:138-443(+)
MPSFIGVLVQHRQRPLIVLPQTHNSPHGFLGRGSQLHKRQVGSLRWMQRGTLTDGDRLQLISPHHQIFHDGWVRLILMCKNPDTLSMESCIIHSHMPQHDK